MYELAFWGESNFTQVVSWSKKKLQEVLDQGQHHSLDVLISKDVSLAVTTVLAEACQE